MPQCVQTTVGGGEPFPHCSLRTAAPGSNRSTVIRWTAGTACNAFSNVSMSRRDSIAIVTSTDRAAGSPPTAGPVVFASRWTRSRSRVRACGFTRVASKSRAPIPGIVRMGSVGSAAASMPRPSAIARAAARADSYSARSSTRGRPMASSSPSKMPIEPAIRSKFTAPPTCTASRGWGSRTTARAVRVYLLLLVPPSADRAAPRPPPSS